MSDYAKQQIVELSGGQQQRIFMARALAQRAEIFLWMNPLLESTFQVKIQSSVS